MSVVILMVIGMATGIIPILILIMVAIQAIMVIIMMARDTVFLRWQFMDIIQIIIKVEEIFGLYFLMALWKILMPDILILVVNKVITGILGLMGILAMAIMVIMAIMIMVIMEEVVVSEIVLIQQNL